MAEILVCCCEIFEEIDCCDECNIDELFAEVIKSQHRIRRCISLICTFIILILTLAYALTQNEYNVELFNILNTIQNNWKIPPIIDLTLSSNCPTDTEILSRYVIPPTVEGCICQDGFFQSESNCEQFLNISLNCTYQMKQSAINLLQMGIPGNNQSFQLCAQRSRISYYEMLQKQIFQPSNCYIYDFKPCIQSPTEFYCVLPSEQCPIRDISLTILDDTYLSIKTDILDSQFQLYISRNQSMESLSNFKICHNSSESIKLSNYPLNLQLPVVCEADETYTLIFSMNQSQYFSLNQLIIENTRHFYPQNTSIQYNFMYQRHYFYFSQEQYDQFYTNQQGSTQTLIYAIIVIVIAQIIYEIFSIANEMCRLVIKLFDINKNLQTLIVFYIIRGIFALTLLIIQILIVIKNYNNSQFCEQQLQFKQYRTDQIQEYYSTLQNLISISRVLLILTIISVAIQLVIILIALYFKFRYLKQIRNAQKQREKTQKQTYYLNQRENYN